MHLLTLVRTLGANDLKNITRDSLLRWMVVIPIFCALLLRWAVPVVIERTQIPPEYIPSLKILLMCGFSILTNPLLIGFVIGMLLLDERDDGTLIALRVTPMSMGNYLAYKLVLPSVISVLMTFITFPLAGILPFKYEYIPIILVASLLGPVCALAMAAFAQNKVQGFALIKALNVVLFPPFVAYFFYLAESPWEYAFGIFPTFWLLEAFWRAETGSSYLLFLLVAAGIHLVLLKWLLSRFQKMALG